MLRKFSFYNSCNLLILSFCIWLSSCRPSSQNDISVSKNYEQPKIVASHSILCDLVETIAENTVDLTCLIDGTQNPHTYSPTPSQLKALETADLILYGGYQLESKVIKLIQATQTTVPKIAVYEQVVSQPIVTEHHHNEHSTEELAADDHEHHSEEETANDYDHHTEEITADSDHTEDLALDPHVWHNVEHTIDMVELIHPLLEQVNSAAKQQYLQNSDDFIEQLEQLDVWIKQQIATIPEGQKILVTTHNSLNYYAQAYGFTEYKTLQGLSLNSATTASQLKELVQEIQQTGISTIFVEANESDRIMHNVARAANVKLASSNLITDGLGIANNYIEMMSHNTCAIVEGLNGMCQARK